MFCLSSGALVVWWSPLQWSGRAVKYIGSLSIYFNSRHGVGYVKRQIRFILHTRAHYLIVSLIAWPTPTVNICKQKIIYCLCLEEDDILSTEKLPDITALWRCVLKGRIMIYVGFQFGNVGKGEPTLVFLTCLPGSHYSYNSGPSRHHSKLRIKLNLQNSNVFSFLLARTKCLNYATWGRTKEGRVRSQRTIIFTKIFTEL